MAQLLELMGAEIFHLSWALSRNRLALVFGTRFLVGRNGLARSGENFFSSTQRSRLDRIDGSARESANRWSGIV